MKKIHKLTKIDYWFLDQIEEILNLEKSIRNKELDTLTKDDIFGLKEKRFLQIQGLAELTQSSEMDFRNLRISHDVFPYLQKGRYLCG